MECHYQDKLGPNKLSHMHAGFCRRTFTILTAANMLQYKVSPRSTMLTILMCVIFSTNVMNVLGCNIDTNRPVIYTAPTDQEGVLLDYSGGLFGYSVLQHAGSIDNFVLIGAPTAPSYWQEGLLEKPGVLFKCSVVPPSCVEVELDTSGNKDPQGPNYKHMKDHAWIGVSLTRQPSSGSVDEGELSDITVCGHRYANDYYVQYSITPDDNTTFDANDRFPNGMCYTFGHRNGDIDPRRSTTSIPCAGYNQTDESTHTRVHGWCQAGMSAQYTSDGNSILLGAAGSYDWTGTVFEGDRVDLDFKPAPDVWGEDNDYTGYAVASGKFRTRDSIQGVASAPRAMRRLQDITTGKVIIYDLETYEVYQELYGDLMNTYFGAAIVAVDLNNDEWTDLLVGAPLYTVEHDEGRVYVYINNGRGQLEPLDFKLSGRNEAGARFGSAMAWAGDLNYDKFQDVVIGSPWEDDNSGAVYVYFGSADGIQSKYSQRLAGREWVPDIKSFGLSVGGGEDSDLNFLPDIVVGAPASDTVILFKTRPVANLEIWLEMDPDPMDPDIQNCALDGKPITCVTVSVCFKYEAVSTPESMDMDIELTADYKKVTQGFPGRFYFLEDDEQVPSIYDLVIARYGQNSCYPYKAYLEKAAQDFLDAVEFHVYYGIHEYPFVENPRGDNPIKFPGGLPPIIDENICGNGSYVDELQFIRDCGADAICQTDVQLMGEVIFPDGESYYTLGAYNRLYADLKVVNDGEEAHDAKVIIRHSREIRFEALVSSKYSCFVADEASCNIDEVVRCQPVEYINNTAAVECIIGNPMKSMTSVKLALRFDIGGVTYENSKDYLDFSIEARTISQEENPSNNFFDPRIPVQVLADSAVNGISDPASVYYETNKTSSENADLFLMEALVAIGVISVERVEEMKSDLEVSEVVVMNVTEEVQLLDEEAVGPPFSLVFEAFNQGPGRLPFDSVVYVSIPWRLTNGDWLIYIKDITTTGVSATCNNEEILALQKYRLEEHYVNRTRATSPTMYERAYDGVHSFKSSSKQLTCSNAMCVTIKCAINVELQKADSFVVKIESLLWVPTFLESALYLKFKEVVSQSVIEVNAPNGIDWQPKDHQPDYFNLATGIFTDKPPAQPVAWWIILLSVLGGILLLILIILILYKVGFFKRKTKDEMEKLQQAANL